MFALKASNVMALMGNVIVFVGLQIEPGFRLNALVFVVLVMVLPKRYVIQQRVLVLRILFCNATAILLRTSMGYVITDLEFAQTKFQFLLE